MLSKSFAFERPTPRARLVGATASGRVTRIIIRNGNCYIEPARRLSWFVIAGLVVVIPILFWLIRRQPPARAEQAAVTGSLVLLASPGRVEGQGETISLGAAADGVVKAVLVTNGQKVTGGTILAVLGCDDLRAEIERARAEAESARQSRIRILRGHREEERQAAEQNTAAAQAVLNQAQEHFKRMDTLNQKQEIPRDVFDQAKRDYEVALANYQSVRNQEELVKSDPLPEEKSRADADVTTAEKNISVVMQKLQKCTIRAPISGTVLKVMAKVGEPYSTLVPRPLFSLADDSIRRVRGEVDEWDIGKVKLGQKTIVTADGFPGRQFNGRVVELAHVMGRRSVLSGDPAEKADRDVLEVIVELDQSANELPVGLRVTVQYF
jgi:multidrug resistance efflux pump